MPDSKHADPHLPAKVGTPKVTEVNFEPVGGADPFWEDENSPHGRGRAPLSFSGRMFNVGWKGWTRLAIVCVIVGAIFQAGGFNPFAPDFTIGAGIGQIVNGVVNIFAWAAQNGGIPLILGAITVLPFWLLWRALVTLFNKDRPPGPHDRILPKERQRKPHRL